MAAELAARLSWGNLHRLWQLLLKGLEDVRIAPDPQEAATMALLRLIHAAEMPDPSALGRDAGRRGGAGNARRPHRQRRPGQQPKSSLPADFPALVDAVERRASNCWAYSCATMSGWSASLPANWS